ncbi:MAG: DUF99 family protein, partial [Caldilinea sp.]
RDGRNATTALIEIIARSRFRPHLQAVLLQGVAFAGFNVIDVPALHAALGVPVIVVARRQPDFAAIRRALLHHVRGGARKWALIERLGPMERCAGVYVQRAGITQKILVGEGTTEFLAETTAYRLLPRERFGKTVPVYIYGDRIAYHTGTLRRRTIIIEDKALAQSQRAIFHSLWNDARGPLSVDVKPWGTRAARAVGR